MRPVPNLADHSKARLLSQQSGDRSAIRLEIFYDQNLQNLTREFPYVCDGLSIFLNPVMQQLEGEVTLYGCTQSSTIT